METKTKVIIGIISALAGTYVALDLISKKKKADYLFQNEPSQQNPMEGKKVIFVEDDTEDKYST